MSLSLDFGLGESGLAQAGVGLGGAGLEGGVAAAAPAGIVVGAGVAYGQTAVNGDMVFTLPAHNNGDLLALAHYIARTDDLNDFVLVTTPGWVELAAAERRVFSGTAMTQRVWTKFGDGVETQVTVNNQYAGGAGFALACVPVSGVDTAIFDVTPLTSHSKLQNNSSNPTAVQLTTTVDGAVMLLFCGHGRTFATYAPPTGYDDNANNSFNPATVYACSKKVVSAGLETPGPWNTTGVNAGADNLLMSLTLLPSTGAPVAPNITDFSAASYSGDISASAVDPNGVFVDESGTRVFIANGSPGNDIDSYSMSTPFDLTTLSAVIASEAITTSPIGVFLKPDGTKLFVTTFSSQIGVQEFPLSTPWDITTKGAMTLLSTAGDGATIPFGLHFSPDGLNVYTSDNGGNLYQWSLASAWDVSSPTFVGSFDFTNEVAATKGQDLSLSNDGTKLYLPDINLGTDSEVFQYGLSVPFDITTAFYSNLVLTLTGRIGSSGFHMLDANDRFYAAYNGDAGGGDPEALEEFTI